MRPTCSIAALAAALLVSPAFAQTGANCLNTISPFAANNGGSAGGAVFFDVTASAGVVLTDFVCNLQTAAASSTVGVDVYTTPNTYVGNEANAGAWTLVGSASGVMTARDQRTICTLASGVVLTPGSYGIALVATGGAAHAYTNGTGANQNFSDAFLNVTLGAAMNVPFSGSPFTPRIANLEICYNPAAGFATATAFGSSCGAGGPENLYELFTTNNDLSNYQGLNAIWTGSSYVIVPGASAIVAPTGTPLALTDDSTLQVTLPWAFPTERGSTNDVWVCSNGWVALETTTSNDLSESVAELLSQFARIACLWDDLNPASGGGVYAEVDPSNPGKFHITYLNVPEFGQATPNTVQLSLDASGNWELKFGAIAALDGLVGYSQGNGVGPSGAVDISALNAPVTFGDGSPAPSLISIARPVIGQTATTQTNDIPTAIRGAFHLYSFNAIPNGLDLTGAGAPGCFLLGTSEVDVGFSTAGGTAQHSLAIPADNSLIGANFYGQSVMLAPGLNGLGVITTNGIRWTFDVN
jgi:hypothetical protein